MKYVMMRATIGNGMQVELPIIFPNVLAHSDVAARIQHIMIFEHDWTDIEPVSAGFVHCTVTVEDRGSETLKLEPRDTDEPHINMIDYNAGIA